MRKGTAARRRGHHHEEQLQLGVRAQRRLEPRAEAVEVRVQRIYDCDGGDYLRGGGGDAPRWEAGGGSGASEGSWCGRGRGGSRCEVSFAPSRRWR